jgi:hypothetical protein
MKNIFTTSIFLSLLLSCSSYNIGKESFINQLKENQVIDETKNVSSLGKSYPSNHLKKIQCIDKKGNSVFLLPDKNVNFVIETNDSKSTTLYYDTAILDKDTIYGLRSRILGGLRKIPIKEIKTIKIKAEAARIEYTK